MKMKNGTKIFLLSLVLVGLIFGIYKFVVGYASPEMVALRGKLEENEKLIKSHNDEIEVKKIEENVAYEKSLKEFDDKASNLDETVKNLNITFIGDSVMLGAVNSLGKTFPKSYSDALTSRALTTGLNIITDMQKSNTLGDIVVINLGANGDCYNKCKEKFMDGIDKSKEVFWLTVTDDYKVNINDKLKALAESYENLHIIDWEQISSGHDDWFYADGIHLPGTGQKAYAEVIFNALKDFYKGKLEKDKEDYIAKHNEELKQGLEIFGNDLIISIFDKIKDDYKDVKVNANGDYKYKDLLNDLKKTDVKNNVLLAFDKSMNLKKKDIEEIVDALGDRKVYVVALNDEIKDIKKDNLIILDLSLDQKEDYLSDKKHLNDKGNEKLIKVIKDKFKLEDTNE